MHMDIVHANFDDGNSLARPSTGTYADDHRPGCVGAIHGHDRSTHWYLAAKVRDGSVIARGQLSRMILAQR